MRPCSALLSLYGPEESVASCMCVHGVCSVSLCCLCPPPRWPENHWWPSGSWGRSVCTIAQNYSSFQPESTAAMAEALVWLHFMKEENFFFNKDLTSIDFSIGVIMMVWGFKDWKETEGRQTMNDDFKDEATIHCGEGETNPVWWPPRLLNVKRFFC